jgi:tetratricopeptide (TPR) repeat protein
MFARTSISPFAADMQCKTTRLSAGAALVAAAMTLAGLAKAQELQERLWCEGKGGASVEQQIAGCSALIDSGRETLENRIAAFNRRAHAYVIKNQHDRALEDYEAVVRLAPNDSEAWLNRGQAYADKGDPAGALADYDEAIRLNPNNARAFRLRGSLFSRGSEMDRAIASYDQAIRLDPRDAGNYVSRAMAYQRKGEVERALADFRSALALNPSEMVRQLAEGQVRLISTQLSCFGRGTARHEPPVLSSELLQQIASCTLLIEADPARRNGRYIAILLNIRGIAYRNDGQHDRAIADYTEAIQLTPSYVNSYINRGTAYRSKGDRERAIADFRRVLTLTLNSDEAQREFAKMQLSELGATP